MTELRPKPNLYVVRPDAIASLTSPSIQNAIRRSWRSGFIAGWLASGAFISLVFFLLAIAGVR